MKFAIITLALILCFFGLTSGKCVTTKNCKKVRVGPMTKKSIKWVTRTVSVPYTTTISQRLPTVVCYTKNVVVKIPYKVKTRRTRKSFKMVRQSYISKERYQSSQRYKIWYHKNIITTKRTTCPRKVTQKYRVRRTETYSQKYKKSVRRNYIVKVRTYRKISRRVRQSYIAQVKETYQKKVKVAGFVKKRVFLRKVRNPAKKDCWKDLYTWKNVRGLVWKKKTFTRIKNVKRYKLVTKYFDSWYMKSVTKTKYIKVWAYRKATRKVWVNKTRIVTVRKPCTIKVPGKRKVYRWGSKLVTKTRNVTAWKLVKRSYTQTYYTIDTKFRNKTIKRAAHKTVSKIVRRAIIKYRKVKKRVQTVQTVQDFNYDNRCTLTTKC